MTALDILKAAATTATVMGSDPIANFQRKCDEQIAFVEQVKAGKEVSKRSLWFKKVGAHYEMYITKSKVTLAGTNVFKADDLDGVINVIKAAKEFVAGDSAVQAEITKQSNARSARLKAGRAKKTK